jgi:hypothetical protein
MNVNVRGRGNPVAIMEVADGRINIRIEDVGRDDLWYEVMVSIEELFLASCFHSLAHFPATDQVVREELRRFMDESKRHRELLASKNLGPEAFRDVSGGPPGAATGSVPEDR